MAQVIQSSNLGEQIQRGIATAVQLYLGRRALDIREQEAASLDKQRQLTSNMLRLNQALSFMPAGVDLAGSPTALNLAREVFSEVGLDPGILQHIPNPRDILKDMTDSYFNEVVNLSNSGDETATQVLSDVVDVGLGGRLGATGGKSFTELQKESRVASTQLTGITNLVNRLRAGEPGAVQTMYDLTNEAFDIPPIRTINVGGQPVEITLEDVASFVNNERDHIHAMIEQDDRQVHESEGQMLTHLTDLGFRINRPMLQNILSLSYIADYGTDPEQRAKAAEALTNLPPAVEGAAQYVRQGNVNALGQLDLVLQRMSEDPETAPAAAWLQATEGMAAWSEQNGIPRDKIIPWLEGLTKVVNEGLPEGKKLPLFGEGWFKGISVKAPGGITSNVLFNQGSRTGELSSVSDPRVDRIVRLSQAKDRILAGETTPERVRAEFRLSREDFEQFMNYVNMHRGQGNVER